MKRMLTFLAALLMLTMVSVGVLADTAHPARVVDDAGLMNEQQVQALTQKLDEISERQQVDVIVVTQNSLDGKEAMDYADDYFDYNGYGIGNDRSGVLLLIGMENRDWWISTRGYGINAFSSSDIEITGENISPDLSTGNYAEAFDRFADIADQYITDAKNGGHPKEPFNWLKAIVIAVVVGLVVGLIVVSGMKKSLKSVHFQKAANYYTRENSVDISRQYDIFLYSHVNRIAKPKNDDHGSHTSSSGASHGGGGGNF